VIPRQQLPVAAPIAARSLVQAMGRALSRRGAQATVAEQLASAFGAARAILTDSGTSALVLALRLTVGEGRTVALPAYGCIDLAAAARFARVRVRLYDIDPQTLNADLASLERTLRRGVDAVVITHLYGYPAEVPAITALCAARGVKVIEDAAQSAGGDLAGTRLGSFGPLTVLSFGRGKGLTCGRGGALLSFDSEWTNALEHAAAGRTAAAEAGWGEIGATAIQWLIGRPSVYSIPASIPGLRLGEMIYRPAHEPRALSNAAASLLTDALRSADAELRMRRINARELTQAGEGCADLRLVRPIAGASPGFLRFPLLDGAGRRPAPRLGILRGYPRALHEQPELAPSLCVGEPLMTGALELRRHLFTLPTHSLVSIHDREKMAAWMRHVTVHP
jgi:perosamine synthetase